MMKTHIRYAVASGFVGAILACAVVPSCVSDTAIDATTTSLVEQREKLIAAEEQKAIEVERRKEAESKIVALEAELSTATDPAEVARLKASLSTETEARRAAQIGEAKARSDSRLAEARHQQELDAMQRRIETEIQKIEGVRTVGNIATTFSGPYGEIAALVLAAVGAPLLARLQMQKKKIEEEKDKMEEAKDTAEESAEAIAAGSKKVVDSIDAAAAAGHINMSAVVSPNMTLADFLSAMQGTQGKKLVDMAQENKDIVAEAEAGKLAA